MSDYEYDTGSTRLVISEGLNIRDDKHFVIVSAEHLSDVNIVVAVQDEDAPAVALSILEAAGIEPDDKELGGPAHTNEQRAVLWLREVQKERTKQAEREAEDAKVVEFRESSMAAIACVFKESDKDPKGWDGLSGAAREGWRARYRAARKFFEES